MNQYKQLMRYIVSEALRIMVGEVSATGGANTGGGDTFKMTPGEGYVTPKAFRRKRVKKEQLREAPKFISTEPSAERDLPPGLKRPEPSPIVRPEPKPEIPVQSLPPAPGQIPTGWSGDIEHMKRKFGKPAPRRGEKDNPYALAHYMAKQGLAPSHAPIPAHEPHELPAGAKGDPAIAAREAELKAREDARRAALGRAKRGPKPKVPQMPPGTNENDDEADMTPAEYIASKYPPMPGMGGIRHPSDQDQYDREMNAWKKGSFNPDEAVMYEKAPPGMEDTVMALKKKFPGEPERAFKIAWSMYNKKNESLKELSDYRSVECPKCHGSGCDLCGNDGEVSQATASRYRDSQKNEAAEEKPVNSKVKYKTKGNNSPVIIINPPEKVEEVAPEGWSGTVKAMKKHKDIENPWALAHYMKKKGAHPHKAEEAQVNELSPELLHKTADIRGRQGLSAVGLAKKLGKKPDTTQTGPAFKQGRSTGHYDIGQSYFDKATALRQHALDKSKKTEAGGATSKPEFDPKTHPISYAHRRGEWNAKKGVPADRPYKHPGKYPDDPSTASAYKQGYEKGQENEVAPPGWEKTVKGMKKHKDIENPWALAWWMKGKGAKPNK